jgi:C4-type Zn-finger protein
MKLHAVVTRRCPFCQHAVNTYVDSRHPANTPHDGDISICANCSGLSVFQGNELRLPRPQELTTAMRDQELLRSIKDVRSALYGWSIF